MDFLFNTQEPATAEQFTQAILKNKPTKIYDGNEGTLPLIEFFYLGDNLCVCATKHDFPMLKNKKSTPYGNLYKEIKELLGDLTQLKFVR